MCSGTDSGDMADKITYLSDSLYKSGYKTAIACCNQDETAKKYARTLFKRKFFRNNN